MKSLFTFRGELNRRDYALAAGVVFFAQHVFVLLAFAIAQAPLALEWWFWLNPLRAFVTSGIQSIALPVWLPLVATAVALLDFWLLCMLSFRRARHAGESPVFAALTVVPVVQVASLLWLCIPGRRETPPEAEIPPEEMPIRSHLSALGLLAGVGVCVAAVAFSALVLRTYGYMLFFVTPFAIGVLAAAVANWNANIGFGATQGVVFSSLGLGALALLFLAFEGVICLVVAAPLIAGMGFLGGAFGQTLMLGRHNTTSVLLVLAALPVLLAGETLAPPRASFENTASMDFDAPPDAVWDAIIHMEEIPDPPAPPFNWGLAYPISGEILGEGVGAVRRGNFSTGVAYERVTEWRPGHKLSFDVLSNPPMMRELSPYEHINAPHIDGYFRSTEVHFTITPLANGRSRLLFITRHELDIEPAIYWTPFAQWMIQANKTRVLNHFRRQAETAARED